MRTSFGMVMLHNRCASLSVTGCEQLIKRVLPGKWCQVPSSCTVRKKKELKKKIFDNGYRLSCLLVF